MAELSEANDADEVASLRAELSAAHARATSAAERHAAASRAAQGALGKQLDELNDAKSELHLVVRVL